MSTGEERRIQRAASTMLNVSVLSYTQVELLDDYEWLLASPDILDRNYDRSRLMAELDNDLVQLANLVSICVRLVVVGRPGEYILAAKKVLQLVSQEG